MLTSHQIRAARALLHWSARELAERAGVHVTTIQRMESIVGNGNVNGMVSTLQKVVGALEREGIEFTSDDGCPGVRMTRPPPLSGFRPDDSTD